MTRVSALMAAHPRTLQAALQIANSDILLHLNLAAVFTMSGMLTKPQTQPHASVA
jgi:hypothetical protein